MLTQDLHIHTVFSSDDSAVLPEQTVELVAFTKHAKIAGISDHFESFMPHRYSEYVETVRKSGLLVGTEVNGHTSVDMAIDYDFDYYIYHCWGNEPQDYPGFERLMEKTGKPVILAHPYAIGTDLTKIPEGSIVEINNRYIWRCDWKKELTPFIRKFRWVFNSDAHQPNWLNQAIARRVGEELGIEETILFPEVLNQNEKAVRAAFADIR